MPNWLDLIRYTAEFTPGIWSADEDGMPGDSWIVKTSTTDEGQFPLVCRVAYTPCHRLTHANRPGVYTDEEALANARLIADAPVMLVMLASVLNAYHMAARFPSIAAELMVKHGAAIQEILSRHVRPDAMPSPPPEEPAFDKDHWLSKEIDRISKAGG